MTTSRIREAADFARTVGIAVPPAIAFGFSAGGGPHPGLALSLALGTSAILALWVRSIFARRLRTMGSVLASFRDGDFSVRARLGRGDTLFDEVLGEVNLLGTTLREHRLGELEAWTLLRKVMAEVDVVVLAFDEEGRVRLANESAARVLGTRSAALIGETAERLGLADLLEGEVPRAVRDSVALGVGPWELRRGQFRLSGQLHTLLVVSDVSGALREQERDAWKRLIRVMGHEINNSLAPIQSISGHLLHTLALAERPPDWEDDAASGLSVIGRRAVALGRFMTAYAELARLPRPKLAPVDVAGWVRRTALLEQRLRVEIVRGPDVTILGDADQLDQLLINLLKNAVDATLEAKRGGVRVRWSTTVRLLELVVEDDGPGVEEATNLFVPFFTTKSGGTGVGLVLVRQIAEAHGGDVTLRTREGASGAEARVRLPLPSRLAVSEAEGT
jgi:nitrogen fixation/metabolism regulation signal transduction histidine kinase